VSGQPIREAPYAVGRLTPFVRVPHRAVRCSVPIHLYVAGDVDDPAALTPGPTTYLVVRDPDMPLQTEALEVQSVFLDALLSSEPLEAMLARSPHVAQWMRWLADLGEARFLVKAAHALAVARLPLHHRDPFDRLLIAQSDVEQMTLVSADPLFSQYGVAPIA
jgi:hypothetical protein